MRLCIPTSTDEGAASAVYGHFGSAPFFVILDTETGAVETVENGDAHHAHGMCQPLSRLDGKKIDAVICGGMGMRAVAALRQAGIRAFRAGEGRAADVAGLLSAGKLEEITPENACSSHGCH